MRMLLSATPAPGNLIPVLTIGRAAIHAGHEVAVLAPEDMRPIVGIVPLLPAAPSWEELLAENVRRHPAGMGAPGAGAELTPEEVAACFADTRLDLGAKESLEIATAWSPDLVIAEVSDSVGPFVAAVLERPWISHGFGVPLPEPFAEALRASAEPHHRHRGVGLPRRAAYLDPWPELLSDGNVVPPTDRIPIALAPLPPADEHQEDGEDGEDPRHVLVSFGTQVSDAQLLVRTVKSILRHVDGRIVVTRGNVRDLKIDDDRVTLVDFVPLGALLIGADVVVTVGGSGTVLAALSRSVPVVVLPVLPSQRWVAERVAAQGAGVVVREADEVGPAVLRLRTDRHVRGAASLVAQSIAALGTPEEALDQVIKAVSAVPTPPGVVHAFPPPGLVGSGPGAPQLERGSGTYQRSEIGR